MKYLALATAVVLSGMSCSSKGDEAPEPKEAKADKKDESGIANSDSVAKPKTNQATAKFADFSGTVALLGAAKLSSYTLLTFRSGKVGLNLAIPSLAKGTYEADQPKQGLAITVTDARAGRMGQPGFKMYKMKSGKVVVQKDGDLIEGTFEGVVASDAEIPVSGSFVLERSRLGQ